MFHRSRNPITDVAGLRVGNASDARFKSMPQCCAADRRWPAYSLGGAPAVKRICQNHNSVEAIHAVVLSGGSTRARCRLRLQAALRENGIGLEIGGFRVPIVPAAILFDLRNGGRDWGRYRPIDLGYEAAQAASIDFALGTAGGHRREVQA